MREIMKITIEFKSVEEYLEFKEKTAQEGRVQEQSICIEKLAEDISDYLCSKTLVNTSLI